MNVKEAQEQYKAEVKAAREKFAQAVCDARKTRSLSQIAQELGVSPQRVQQISKGR